MCASSCWKRRTRVRPVRAPLQQNRRIGANSDAIWQQASTQPAGDPLCQATHLNSLRCSTPKSASLQRQQINAMHQSNGGMAIQGRPCQWQAKADLPPYLRGSSRYDRVRLANIRQWPGQFMGLRPYSAFSTCQAKRLTHQAANNALSAQLHNALRPQCSGQMRHQLQACISRRGAHNTGHVYLEGKHVLPVVVGVA